MKNYLIFILSVLIFSSCDSINGSGHIKKENRNVGDFDGIQTSGSMDIEVTDVDKSSVEVEADDNVLPYIITDVNDGILNVYYKSNTTFNNAHAKVYVTATGLKSLAVEGSGNITSKNIIQSKYVSTKISGSGDINVTIDAPEVKAEIDGSGNLGLQGRCKNFYGSIKGSGDLKCKNLLSENTTVNIYGSGTAHVFASVQLKASTAGSGDIYYSGKPVSQQINKAGIGTIEAE